MGFSYSQPVKIFFGAGERGRIGEIAASFGHKRALVIADGFLAANGVAGEIAKCAGTDAVLSAFGADPDISAADDAAKIARDIAADHIVAVGGGSAIDLGKFVAVAAKTSKSAEELFYGDIPEDGLPVIALPTTAGTGSEVTGVSVMSDGKRGVKKPLSSPAFFAEAAVVDPKLTLTVPPFVTATCGLDAIAHAVEAYWCRRHNPVSDAFAEKALKLLFGAIDRAYDDGSDISARTDMSMGALLAGLAFAPTRTAAVHACSYPLSEGFGLPHGEACAFTLDLFLRMNSRFDAERLTALAKTQGFASADAMADAIVRIKKKTGMRSTLKDIGCADIASLARECAVHPLMQNNIRAYSAEELAEAFGGLD